MKSWTLIMLVGMFSSALPAESCRYYLSRNHTDKAIREDTAPGTVLLTYEVEGTVDHVKFSPSYLPVYHHSTYPGSEGTTIIEIATTPRFANYFDEHHSSLLTIEATIKCNNGEQFTDLSYYGIRDLNNQVPVFIYEEPNSRIQRQGPFTFNFSMNDHGRAINYKELDIYVRDIDHEMPNSDVRLETTDPENFRVFTPGQSHGYPSDYPVSIYLRKNLENDEDFGKIIPSIGTYTFRIKATDGVHETISQEITVNLTK